MVRGGGQLGAAGGPRVSAPQARQQAARAHRPAPARRPGAPGAGARARRARLPRARGARQAPVRRRHRYTSPPSDVYTTRLSSLITRLLIRALTHSVTYI